jgi:hypothetical protein
MSELTHDPSEYIRGFQSLLIGDKKKIAFLFGAGTSMAKKNEKSIIVPAMGELTKNIETELGKIEKYKKALTEIKTEIGEDKYNVETLLSNLEQKRQIIAKGTLNGLNQKDFLELTIKIKDQIRENMSVHLEIEKNPENLEHLIHTDFAEWIGRADRKFPIEIFTTNYDYLFELGLETKNVPYYDGFTGSYTPFYNSESVEDLCFLPRQTKLWKIHGSLGWHFNKVLNKVFRKDSSDEDILIYPSTLKYSDSKKQPYMSLLDRLSSFLKQEDAVLITCGYSFSDEHINERILTALNSEKAAHVFALFYDIVEKEKLKEYRLINDSSLVKLAKTNSRLSVYGCRSAVIGCQFGKWKLKKEPDKSDTIQVNTYFDEDAFVAVDKVNVEKKGDEIWSGEGELVLPNFVKLVGFFKAMIVNSSINQLANK